ncbi:MAG: hypothetical protein U1A25_01195 [Candidatus Sungbacteria bacterium]|nr:hypothetical protein [bacterium]MDZ4260255.1 hypothetical protein [Candidatus Sungbacteria bacterium]
MKKDITNNIHKIAALFSLRSMLLCAIFILMLIVASELIFVGKAVLLPSSGEGKSLRQYAQQVMETCASSSYRPGCYDKEIPKLMDMISMEDSFTVTRIIQEKDSDYWYCHVLGHNVSGRETAKNPEKWKEVIPRCPSGTCSNGCIHGALQERFRKEKFSEDEVEKVLPDLSDICDEKPDWHPTGMERSTCYHALGHLLMYLTAADAKKSVDVCARIAHKSDGGDFTQVCYDGVFMQLFQPLEPEDIALIEGKTPQKEELKSFCAPYDTQPRASCWSEGWPLFWEQVKKPEGLVRFCSVLEEGTARQRCYNGMFFVMAAQFRLDEEKIFNFCREIPLPSRERCFANGAGRMIETDFKLIGKALEICHRAVSVAAGDACYAELVTYAQFNFHRDSKEQKELCEGLPSQWRTNCGSPPQANGLK